MQECVSEFICFVTSEASEKCRKERRKTVNGDDICCAMETLGFDDYAGLLRRFICIAFSQEFIRVVFTYFTGIFRNQVTNFSTCSLKSEF
ncbi:hypothetical protein NL676_029902 [Syzygium grande]|nr:hypothetical protein NL676_029902 [Syzygium grande]